MQPSRKSFTAILTDMPEPEVLKEAFNVTVYEKHNC